MKAVAYLTRYDALLCVACATDTTLLVGEGQRKLAGLTPLDRALFDECCVDVYGYDRAGCEECETVLYDGLAGDPVATIATR